MSVDGNFSWTALYNKMKKYLADGRPDSWVISTIQNSREMKTTYAGPTNIISILNYLEGKASEEAAIANGDIIVEGGIFSSVAQF